MSQRRRIAGETRPGSPQSRSPQSRSPMRPLRQRATPQDSAASSRTVQLGRRKGNGDDAQPVKPRRTFLLLVCACLVIAVAGTGFGLWKGGVFDGDDSLQEAHQAAAAQAGKDVVTVFSYQYDSLDTHLSDAKALMTDSFAEKFEEISPALSKLAPENKVRVEATTRNYAPMDCGDECSKNKASILVFMDQARTQGDGEPTVFGNRIVVEMVRTDGDWLIDDIRTL